MGRITCLRTWGHGAERGVADHQVPVWDRAYGADTGNLTSGRRASSEKGHGEGYGDGDVYQDFDTWSCGDGEVGVVGDGGGGWSVAVSGDT